MDQKYEKYDSVFSGILQNEGDITNFIDSFFSFLYRRTDFFVHLLTPTGKLGFRPGVAKKMILEIFKRYENLASGANKKLLNQLQNSIDFNNTTAIDKKEITNNLIINDNLNTSVPKINMVETVGMAANSNITNDITSTRDIAIPAKSTAICDAVVTNQETIVDNSVNDHSSSSFNDAPATAVSVPASTAAANEDNDDKLTEDQLLFQSKSESYNGAIRENYSWSQSIKDIDVYIKVPPYIRIGKQITIKIDKRHMFVSFQSETGNSKIVKIDEALSWDVNKEESMWTLAPEQHIHINLEKVESRWWDRLLTSEEKISVRKIDASQPITDLDDEAQSKIDELMFNERQKQLGLPQSHERKIQDILKTAWDAEGSPFKGQPYDPSIVNIQNNSL